MKTIKTFAQLKTAMQAFVKTHGLDKKRGPFTGIKVDDKAVMWLVALHNAAATLDGATTKDIAEMLVEGVKPMTKADVVEWLVVAEEDSGEPNTAESLDATFREHFGVRS